MSLVRIQPCQNRCNVRQTQFIACKKLGWKLTGYSKTIQINIQKIEVECSSVVEQRHGNVVGHWFESNHSVKLRICGRGVSGSIAVFQTEGESSNLSARSKPMSQRWQGLSITSIWKNVDRSHRLSRNL
jgi:hypothetical protein